MQAENKKCLKTDNPPKKNPVGRKPALTPEIEDKLIADLTKGYPVGMVLAINMVDENVYVRALKRLEFRRRVDAAKTSALIPAVDTVMLAKNTQAGAQWLLERRVSEEFGARNKMQVEQVKPVKTIVKKYSLKDADKR